MKYRKVLAVLLCCFFSMSQASICFAQSAGSNQNSTSNSSSMNLNLNSTHATLSAASLFTSNPTHSTALIHQGNSTMTVNQNSLLTPAQFVALSQVLSSGSQTLQLNGQGAATGGSFLLGSSWGSINNLIVPHGVTAIDNLSSGLNLSGKLVNAGNLFAVSTNPALTTANISAANITNTMGGMISSLIPAGGLAGLTNLDPHLNLNLSATNSILNSGIISSAGTLGLNAGTSIVNALPAGVTGPTPLMQAMGNVNIQTPYLANSGIISSLTGNINLLPTMTSSFIVNNTGGQIQAFNGNINIDAGANTLLQNLQISGGDFLSKAVNVNAPLSAVSINTNSISGLINMNAYSADTSVSSGALNLGSMAFTGDPLFYDSSSAGITIGPISTNGNMLVVVSAGDIFVTGALPLTTQSISTSQAAGGSGGDVILAAGAKITTPGSGLPAGAGTSIQITGFNSTGNITVQNDISTVGVSGGSPNNNGGAVTLVAPGFINVGGSILTGGTGTGTNGNVKIIAGLSSGGAILLNSSNGTGTGVNTTGGSGGGGTIGLFTSTPVLNGASLTMDGATCTGCAAALIAGAANNAQTVISTSQFIIPADGQLSGTGTLFVQNNVGNLQVLAPGNSTATLTFPNMNFNALGNTVQFSASGGNPSILNLQGNWQVNAGNAIIDAPVTLSTNGIPVVQGNASVIFNLTNPANTFQNNGVIQFNNMPFIITNFLLPDGATFTNSGTIQATNSLGAVFPVIAAGSLTVAGNGNMLIPSGGTIQFVSGGPNPNKILDVTGSMTFNNPGGFVQFIANTPGGVVDFGPSSVQSIIAAEHMLLQTNNLVLETGATINATGANHIFLDPVTLNGSITITLPATASATINCKSLEIDEGDPFGTTVRFSSSIPGTAATLNLAGGPMFAYAYNAPITIDPAVIINSNSQQINLISSTLNLGANSQVSVGGATAANLVIQGNDNFSSVTVNMAAGAQLSNTSGPGGILTGGLVLFDILPTGSFSTAEFNPSTGNVNGTPFTQGPITLNVTGALNSLATNGFALNAGNNPIVINANSINAALAASGSSVNITSAGNIVTTPFFFLTPPANLPNLSNALQSINGSISLMSTGGTINSRSFIRAANDVSITALSDITYGAGIVSAGYTLNSNFVTGAVLQTIGSTINITSQTGAITLTGTQVAATGNVNITANNGITLNNFPSAPCEISAGVFASGLPAFPVSFNGPQYSTSFNSQLSGIASPGALNITNNGGAINITNNLLESFGGDTSIINKSGDINVVGDGSVSLSGNFMFANGGNFLLNAAGNVNISTINGGVNSIGAVSKFNGGTSVPILNQANPTLPGWQGGDILLVGNQLVGGGNPATIDQFLRNTFDVARQGQSYLNPDFTTAPYNTLPPSPGTPTGYGTYNIPIIPSSSNGGITNGGLIVLNPATASNPNPPAMNLSGVTIQANGSVVYLDPVTITGSTIFGAFGVPSSFVPGLVVPCVGCGIVLLPSCPGCTPSVVIPGFTVPANTSSTTILKTDALPPQPIDLNSQTIAYVTINDLDEGVTVGGGCQQLVIELKDKAGTVYATLVAEGGTTMQADTTTSDGVEQRMLTLKEGKIVIISGDKTGFKVKANNGLLNIPPDTVTSVELKERGGVIADVIAGNGELSGEVKGYAGDNKFLAKVGEEIAFGNDADKEELIPVDGGDREVVNAHILVASATTGTDVTESTSRFGLQKRQNMVVEKRTFNPDERIKKEPLLTCLDCLSAKCSKEQCQNLIRKLRQSADISERIEDKKPYRPIAATQAVFTASAPVQTMQTETALIKHLQGIDIGTLPNGGLSLLNGDYLLHSHKETVVKGTNAIFKMAPDTVALVRQRPDSISISNLWDSQGNAIEVHSAGKRFTIHAGEETVIGNREIMQTKIFHEPIGRRRIHAKDLSQRLSAIVDEVSFASLFSNSQVLKKTCLSKETGDKDLIDKMEKMATVLSIVTANHGPYSKK